MLPVSRLRSRALAVAASGLLCGGFALAGEFAWPLGFIALVPWLRSLDAEGSRAAVLLSAWAMALAYTLAVFAWFGQAVGHYTGLGEAAGLALLLALAPLFQPQFLAFALVRQAVGRWRGRGLAAAAGAAAWVAVEWALPKVLGDTLGHGLYPAAALRQAASLGGAAGLSLVLLLANEAIAATLARRGDGRGRWLAPLALAASLAALPALYGLAVLQAPAPQAPTLRIGLIQSNITDYERLRRERGAGEVVRDVLNTHFAMSYDAIERQGADTVLWSETVYPTTFGRPKSEAGAELDREILETVDAARVPFVFGTYDRDDAGEYNAAAFVMPGTGLIGHYRKTRLFPYSEFLPAPLEGLRRWLPGAGHWQAGNGARVFPLRLADGRELPVLPLICLDDTDTDLAIQGARLGALAILTMSNDAWFTAHPQGMALHQAVAAFRSIETGLPQFRVTTNGLSALIDRHGRVIAGSRPGERSLVVGELPVAEPRPTLMRAWGNWVGAAATAFLLVLAVWRLWPRRAPSPAPGAPAAALPRQVALLPPAARIAAGLLRGGARLGLLGMAAVAAFGDGAWQAQPLAQLRVFSLCFLAPEVAAWCLLWAYSAQMRAEPGHWVLTRGGQQVVLDWAQVAAVRPWRLPLPCEGAWLETRAGDRWPFALAGVDPAALARAHQEAVPAAGPGTATTPLAQAWTAARHAVRPGLLGQPMLKYGLLPLLLALPAFRLHQHIAFGSSFGEFYSFGLAAYLKALALWWATWAMGVLMCAAVLRALVEAGALAALLLGPAAAAPARRRLEALALGLLYLGLPAWLGWRLLQG